MSAPERFTCACCGQVHDLSALSFGAAEPAQWRLLSDAERAQSVLGDDQCEIQTADGKTAYYIRACLEIPIRGSDTSYSWGVWCSLSAASYAEVCEHWDDPARDQIGPHFGWLCTAIPHYPDTVYLKTRVHQNPPGQRPWVELEPTDHPLAIHQRDGIDPADLHAIVTDLLHPDA